MGQVSKVTAKGYFNTGDIPSEANFEDLIDSALWYDESYTASYPPNFAVVTSYGVATGNTGLVNASAIQTAIDTGKPVIYIPKGTYTFEGATLGASAFTLQAGQVLMGEGEQTILQVTTNHRIVAANTGCKFLNLQFKGSGKNDGKGFQSGIFSQASFVEIIGCTFKDLSGTPGANGGGGIELSTFPNPYYGVRIVSNHFDSCNCGINVEARAEYCSISDNQVHGCNVGIHLIGGNNTFSTNTVTYNVVGVKIRGGVNDGHSSFTACMISHNTTSNLDVDTVTITLPITFSNCHLNLGDIIIDDAGVIFDGGFLYGDGAVTFDINGTAKVYISAATNFPKTPTGRHLVLTVAGTATLDDDSLNMF